ncbi:MAG TPA: spore germination protein [Ruminiclostridium sp.]|nr:spore germination protein [Ruminiclostridium sp.]
MTSKELLKYFASKFSDIGTLNKEKPEAGSAPEYTQLKKNLLDNMTYIQGQFDGCADFVSKELVTCNRKAAIICMDNMIDKLTLTQSVLGPLSSAAIPLGVTKDEDIFNWFRDKLLSSIDEKEAYSYEEAVGYVMAGYAVLFMDGVNKALAFGIQGYKYRSIDEPNTETTLRGSREGFVEPLRINLMLVRRRIKNPNLKFEVYVIGKETKTEICLAYIKGTVEEETLNQVRHKIKTINMDTVLASGYIQKNFQDSPYSIFSTVGTTERPDTLCGRLNEGRVGIIVDNTPLALTMPFLFVENFQNMDDYAVGPYYATFTRILKYLAFFTSVFIPGLYVAVGSFHQALLPSQLLYALAQAEEATPFPLFFEALLMQIIYEMVREAGLRLPKQIGFAINIVGALIIGQAAVSAGLIGAPMVIIVAITATTTLIIPTLYESGVVLRFAFIILAGMAGMYGIILGIAFFGFHLSAIKSYEVPYTAPLSPFNARAQRDVLVRAPWNVLSKRKIAAQDLPGANIDKTQS